MSTTIHQGVIPLLSWISGYEHLTQFPQPLELCALSYLAPNERLDLFKHASEKMLGLALQVSNKEIGEWQTKRADLVKAFPAIQQDPEEADPNAEDGLAKWIENEVSQKKRFLSLFHRAAMLYVSLEAPLAEEVMKLSVMEQLKTRVVKFGQARIAELAMPSPPSPDFCEVCPKKVRREELQERVCLKLTLNLFLPKQEEPKIVALHMNVLLHLEDNVPAELTVVSEEQVKETYWVKPVQTQMHQECSELYLEGPFEAARAKTLHALFKVPS